MRKEYSYIAMYTINQLVLFINEYVVLINKYKPAYTKIKTPAIVDEGLLLVQE